jgi:NADH dehydrogenase subunit M (EC 1.6.5.3)
MLLGGLLAKLGAYGLLRYCMPLFPDAWHTLAPFLALWGGLGILYGAFTAIAQKDIKRMVAYSSIGHMSYILLALAADTPLSLVGGGFPDGQPRLDIGFTVLLSGHRGV